MSQEPPIRHPGPVGRAIQRWLEEGLIDAATAARLVASETAQKPRHTGRLAILAFGFGGLLVAAGIFLFVAANWQELSPWSRFAILLGTVAALHVGGAFGGRFSPALATSLHAAGTAALGAGILLSGQIFNLQENWPEALLLWALGAGAAALLLRDWPQVLWTAVLGPAWLVAEWFSSFPWYRLLAGESAASIVPFGLTVMSAAYLSATTRQGDTSWRRALAVLGAIGLIAFATELAEHGGDYPPETELTLVPASLLACGWTVAVGLPMLIAALLRKRQAWPVAVTAVLAAVVVWLDPAVAWQRLATYLVYGTGSAGLVWWGLMDRQRLRINLGVLCFVLTVLAFYFSSLFDMLGRSVGLIGMGVLCIAGGWQAERTRRRLIARIGEEER
jgi:uncharacterized membrane protein